MTFKIENPHLQITEDDVRECSGMNKLRRWEEEISKQVVVMNGKIRAAEAEELESTDMKENINRTKHARDLQGVLLKMVQNRLDTLREERINSMEALYFTFAEKELDVKIHNKIMKKVDRAMEGSL
jgi:hypothetical protein